MGSNFRKSKSASASKKPTTASRPRRGAKIGMGLRAPVVFPFDLRIEPLQDAWYVAPPKQA